MLYIVYIIVSSSKLRKVLDQKTGSFYKTSETILLRLQLFRYFVPLQTNPQNMFKQNMFKKQFKLKYTHTHKVG